MGSCWPPKSPFAVLILTGAAAASVGCASDEAPEPTEDTRPRIDQILSPQGSKPNDAYTKRSRYDGQNFRSKSLDKKAFAGAGSDGRAREGTKEFSGADREARWGDQKSRFDGATAREGGQSAKTFTSRFDNQAARTKSFAGSQEDFRTGEARESEEAFRTGEPRAYSTRTLGATQLSPTARETARLFPADATAPLNEEDVRRVLNKGPRD